MTDAIDKKMIAQSFGRAATTYDAVAHFQRWVGSELLDKAPSICPEVVLDLGCGTGYFHSALNARFPGSAYIGLDLSEQMLKYAKGQHLASVSAWLAADAESLPFRSQSVDLMFSSLAIQWCSNLPVLLKEVKRVLKPGGVFVFSTLLDGTLSELKESWAAVDDRQHVNRFLPFDYFAAMVQQTGFHIQMLEQEKRVLKYQKVTELMRELKALGAHNLHADRMNTLSGRQTLRTVTDTYELYRGRDGLLPASYQVLWGVLER